MTPVAPDMTDFYRQLLAQLTAKFGGHLDDTNADAIAFAAAELYHRDFEPRLWQEKSTHELLDLLGVPRAGVFAPHSLSERLLLLQRRTSQATYVARAHDLLTALGVPRQDNRGEDQSVRWRLERLLGGPVAVPVVPPEAADDERDKVAPEPQPEEADTAPRDEDEGPEDEGSEDDEGEGEGGRDERLAGDEAQPDEDEGADEGQADEGTTDPDDWLTAVQRIDEAAAPVREDGVDVDDEAGAAPLVDAVRALEQAARLEAALAEGGAQPPGIDLVRLNETMNGIHAELAALRAMVEALGIELRERLELVHEEVLVATGVLRPDRAQLAAMATQDVPVVAVDEADSSEPEAANGRGRRSLRRVMLVVILLALGFLLAGTIILIAVNGWETVRNEITGLLSFPAVTRVAFLPVVAQGVRP